MVRHRVHRMGRPERLGFGVCGVDFGALRDDPELVAASNIEDTLRPIAVTRLELVSTEEIRNANVNIDGSFSPGCVEIYVL
ncbi:hypothetical protein FOTG_18228 [Fusarium oxysporum f. sp. vasinfectum 25433]|uniref:Uncharacterized protein n=1 Tax=Fusarium oxysporum f. sp. vasinfectum 25433 TaxID=1089449 RepID=X0LY01_FUSOX|nr:hypothetical protein FOTG_18228 [Fusarium oxysporum f. sp. vasinfectum 25433]